MQKVLYIWFLLALTWQPLLAQQNRLTYTNDNVVFITLEGTSGLYEYTSREMLVRYNENTKKIECIINLNSLLPANDSSPVVMVQDVFFATRHPELLLEIEAPVEKINAANLYPETLQRNMGMVIQNIPVTQRIPVSFTPDKKSLKFTTDFEVFFSDYRIGIPAKYIPFISGRVKFAIRNAQSIELFSR